MESQTSIEDVYCALSPIQQKIFEYTVGYRDAPKLSNPRVMRKLRLTQGQLSYQKSLIVEEFQQYYERIDVRPKGEKMKETEKAIGAAATGAGAGLLVTNVVGRMGLAFAGTAIGIGASVTIPLGAVLGLVGYGLYRAFSEESRATQVRPAPLAKLYLLDDVRKQRHETRKQRHLH